MSYDGWKPFRRIPIKQRTYGIKGDHFEYSSQCDYSPYLSENKCHRSFFKNSEENILEQLHVSNFGFSQTVNTKVITHDLVRTAVHVYHLTDMVKETF